MISALFGEKNPQRQFFTQLFFENIEAFDTYIFEVILAEIDETRDTRLRKKLRESAVSFKILLIYEKYSALLL